MPVSSFFVCFVGFGVANSKNVTLGNFQGKNVEQNVEQTSSKRRACRAKCRATSLFWNFNKILAKLGKIWWNWAILGEIGDSGRNVGKKRRIAEIFGRFCEDFGEIRLFLEPLLGKTNKSSQSFSQLMEDQRCSVKCWSTSSISKVFGGF